VLQFDEHVGNTSRILLLSLRTIRDANIDILHHMDKSLERISSLLLFLQDRKPRKSTKKGLPSRAQAAKKFLMMQKRKLHRGNSCAVFLASSTPAAREYVEGRLIEDDEGQLHCLCEMDEDDKWMVTSNSLSQGIIQEDRATSLQDCYISPFAYEEHEAYMSEIQLRRIADKKATEASERGADGDDELMVKDGKTFSKFSKDALEIGEDVGAFILGKVRKIFDLNKGDDAVFRTRNGAPKIMTKFKDKPYSYELLPEYANGSKKFPTIKSMNWEGKTATAKVIRGFTESTPVVQRCPNPRSISRLVIIPKLAPGQPKNDPDHGFRVCVNALINKCIKPDASTIPLAVDEIKKLAHCKYFYNWMEQMHIGASQCVRKALGSRHFTRQMGYTAGMVSSWVRSQAQPCSNQRISKHWTITSTSMKMVLSGNVFWTSMEIV
jgi:hypothetical protein